MAPPGPGPLPVACDRSERASSRAISSGWSNGFAITSSAPASMRAMVSSSWPLWATARTGRREVWSPARSIVTTSPTVAGAVTESIIIRL